MRIAADGRDLLPEEPGVSSGLRLSLSRAGMAAATLGNMLSLLERVTEIGGIQSIYSKNGQIIKVNKEGEELSSNPVRS